MKEITKEKKSTYTVYQAIDGTEFGSALSMMVMTTSSYLQLYKRLLITQLKQNKV